MNIDESNAILAQIIGADACFYTNGFGMPIGQKVAVCNFISVYRIKTIGMPFVFYYSSSVVSDTATIEEAINNACCAVEGLREIIFKGMFNTGKKVLPIPRLLEGGKYFQWKVIKPLRKKAVASDLENYYLSAEDEICVITKCAETNINLKYYLASFDNTISMMKDWLR
jgi:hypothetical protein